MNVNVESINVHASIRSTGYGSFKENFTNILRLGKAIIVVLQVNTG